jgi:hypothetical protein
MLANTAAQRSLKHPLRRPVLTDWYIAEQFSTIGGRGRTPTQVEEWRM